MDEWVGDLNFKNNFGIGSEKSSSWTSGFKQNDVVGCGVAVMAKKRAKNGEAAKCVYCRPRNVIFFTKNGEILGNFNV